MARTLLAGAAVALALLPAAALGVEIAEHPETRPASPTGVAVRWTTDCDPAYITVHEFTVPLRSVRKR